MFAVDVWASSGRLSIIAWCAALERAMAFVEDETAPDHVQARIVGPGTRLLFVRSAIGAPWQRSGS